MALWFTSDTLEAIQVILGVEGRLSRSCYYYIGLFVCETKRRLARFVSSFSSYIFFFFSSRRRHTRLVSDWSSDVCSSDLLPVAFNNSATARLRFYCHNGTGGTTGSRPKISIDNLMVTAAPLSPAVSVAAEIGRASCRERV